MKAFEIQAKFDEREVVRFLNVNTDRFESVAQVRDYAILGSGVPVDDVTFYAMLHLQLGGGVYGAKTMTVRIPGIGEYK